MSLHVRALHPFKVELQGQRFLHLRSRARCCSSMQARAHLQLVRKDMRALVQRLYLDLLVAELVVGLLLHLLRARSPRKRFCSLGIALLFHRQ